MNFTQQRTTKNKHHNYCHLEMIIYCFTMTQQRNNIKRIFITNPNFLPRPHYPNIFFFLSDTTGLLKWTIYAYKFYFAAIACD